jgi:hypothetical protein
VGLLNKPSSFKRIRVATLAEDAPALATTYVTPVAAIDAGGK